MPLTSWLAMLNLSLKAAKTLKLNGVKVGILGAKSNDLNRLMEEEVAKIAERDGLTELMLFSAQGKSVKAREIIESGVDINLRNNLGATALIYAAKNGDREIVALLLKSGADKTITDQNGYTAADHARKNGFKIIEEMLRK